MSSTSYIFVTFAIALVPFVLSLATSYLKISVVLTIFRSGLGAQNIPNMMVIVALSVTLTCAVMGGVFEKSLELLDEERIKRLETEPVQFLREDLTDIIHPWREFLESYAGERELSLLCSHIECNKSEDSEKQHYQLRVLLPAFVLSELKRAFQMGLVILIPFLLIDLIVSTLLVGLGMYMLSPVMISLPLKLMIFTLADGWLLLAKSLLLSYGVS